MKNSKKSYYKIYRAALKKPFKYFSAGNVLRLEYHKKTKKWHIVSNTEWQFYFDTFKIEEVKEYFGKLNYLRTDVYTRL